MIPIILLLLLLSPAWSLAQATEELSLVEAARRERERRASFTEEVKILTNRDIEEMEGLVSTATASEPAAKASEEVESEGLSLEATFDKARTELQSAENRDRLLQLRMKYLRDQWLGNPRRPDGVTQQKVQAQLQTAPSATSAIVETQKELNRRKSSGWKKVPIAEVSSPASISPAADPPVTFVEKSDFIT